MIGTNVRTGHDADELNSCSRMYVPRDDGRRNMQIKSWAHTALAVRDLDQAIAFYREAFGFKVEFEQRGMLEQSAAVTGIPGQQCDIAHLRSAFSEHTLELVRFYHHSEEVA